MRCGIFPLRLKHFTIILLFIIMQYAPPSFGANKPTWLYEHPKISDAQTLSHRFTDSRSVAPVIIHYRFPEKISAPGNLKSEKNRLKLRNMIHEARGKISGFLTKNTVQVNHHFDYMPVFAASVSLETLKILAENPDIVSIAPDRIIHPHTSQGIPLMNASAVRNVYGGEGVSIAICDTGIDYSHEYLGNGGFPNSKVIGGYDFGGSNPNNPYGHDSDPMDTIGHGTSCAGIAAGNVANDGDYIGGVAPMAKLYALKISADGSSSAYESDLLAAWEWCISHKNSDPDNPIVVISTSYGGGQFSGTCDTVNSAVTRAASNVINAGICLFASSGNDGYCGYLAWPACISHVISVGAVFDESISGNPGFCVDSSSCAENKVYYTGCATEYVAWTYSPGAGQVIPFTNVSEALDFFAPSYAASTPDLGGGLETTFSGTSAACPYAAGIAAVIQAGRKSVTGVFLDPSQVKMMMKGFGVPITYDPSGDDGDITRPLPDLASTDIDGDTIPSGWEIEYFGTLEEDGDGDYDVDELSNLMEYQIGTNPADRDTDDDGYSDGMEISAGTDPLDPASHVSEVTAAGWPAMAASMLLLFFFGCLFYKRDI